MLTGFAAFEVYRSLSFSDAEYQGELFLYIFAKSAPYIIWGVIIWEFLCLVGLRRWKNAGIQILKMRRWLKSRFSKMLVKTKLIILCCGIGFVILSGMGVYNYFNKCDTEYYESIAEFYGIPDGVGEPLSPEDLADRAGYWRIDDYPRKHRMRLTYVDAYSQLELMKQYSSAYEMTLFQPSACIEYSYRENEEKFHSYGKECYDQAKEHGFREPEKVTYYASNGKVLLELSGDGYEKLKIDTYSPEEAPQLLYSTLLRLPDGQTMENGADYWQIEIRYGSNGMPVMRKLSTNVCNPYGINGERYTYDSDNRLESILYLDVNGMPACNKQGIMLITFQYDENGGCKISYYSDENGTERTEGFYGVCCEEIKYDSKGKVTERRQMDKRNRWCCDINGVYKYIYEYEEGRLVSEAYYGVDEQLVRNSRFDSKSVGFSLKMDEEEKIIEVFLDYGEPILVSSEASETRTPKSDYLIQAVFSQNADLGKEEKDVWTEQSLQLTQKMDSAKEPDDLQYDGDESANGQEKKRNYTLIKNIITKDSLVMEYCDANENVLINEKGYALKRISYDEKMRVTEEAYLGLDGELCPMEDGYVLIETVYRSKTDDKIESIDYIGADGERITNKKEGYSSVHFQYAKQGETDVVTKYYYDSFGNPVYLPKLGYVAVDYLYNKNGVLIQETYRDENGAITVRNDYMVAEILYEYSDDGNLSRIWYKDADEKPTNRLDTGYAVIYQEFEAGKLVRRHYEGYRNQDLRAVPDKTTGICDTVYCYAEGALQQEQYFDEQGNPALRSDTGCAAISYEYDNNGNISSKRFYDMDGKLTLRKDTGYAVVQYEYDEKGEYGCSWYLGVDEQPVISSKYLCAGIKNSYDEMGNITEIQYLDFDGSLLNVSNYGFARVYRTYNGAGNMETEAYFDAAGAPAVHKEYGYSMYENSYNDDGTLRECRYYDFLEGQKELTMRRDTGYAIIRYRYDDNGNCSSRAYFDTEEQPVISTEFHCAEILSKYDDYGNEIETEYLDLDGSVMNRDDFGFAKVCREYDAKTCKLLKESYFDADGMPTARKEHGYASYVQCYDERGNCIETRYYDADGELTFREDLGYAIVRSEYNEHDELTAQYFHGKNEELVIGTEYHCAGFLYTYDNKGLWTQTRYLGIDGELAVRSDYGCAYVCAQYDAAGRLVGEAYFGTDGRPIIRKDSGYASYMNTYVDGRVVERRYYGLQKELVPDKETGYAIVRWKHDEYGNKEESLFFGVEEEPVISSKYQCAGIKYGVSQ